MKPNDLDGVKAIVGPNGMKVAFVTITPTMAEKWLEAKAPNRNLRTRQSEKLARAIIHNEWIVTHQGIAFRASDGAIIDGQHRLQAIVEAGVPVTCLVAWELADESVDVIDTGTTRNAVDIFSLKGVENAKRLLSLCRQLQTIFAGASRASSTVLSPQELQTIVDWAREPLDWALLNFQNRRGVDAAPIAAACMFARQKNPAAVQEFVHKLQGEIPTSTTDIAVQLRERILTEGSGHTEQDRAETVGMTLSALRNYIEGKNVSYVKRQGVVYAKAFFEKAWLSSIGEWPLG